jgi:beta-glucanase (GH16 family)
MTMRVNGHRHTIRRRPREAAQLIYSDDFEVLDWSKYLSRWWYTDPAADGCSLPSNGELQLYVNKDGPLTATPWTVADSVLSLTAAPDDTYGYLSGMLNTYGRFQRTYGYWEVRAKMPPGAGMWPAFWLLPAGGGWPPEIDVVEWLGRDPLVRYCGTHSSALGFSKSTQDGSHPIPDGSADFHTYGCDWQATTTAFYFDGQEMSTFQTLADMHSDMYFVLNLAIGGGWAGPPNADTVFPASYQVDYVKVWDVCPYGGDTPAPEPPREPQTFTINSPWGSVDLRSTFVPGDQVILNFAYDSLEITQDKVNSWIWARNGTNLTLAVVLPVVVSHLA